MELIDKLFSIIYGTEHTKLSVGRKYPSNCWWWWNWCEMLFDDSWTQIFAFCTCFQSRIYQCWTMLNEVWGKVICLHACKHITLPQTSFNIVQHWEILDCPQGGGCLLLGGAWSEGGAWLGVPAPGGLPAPRGVPGLVGAVPGGVPGGDPRMATAAGGTHTTGMHSCHLQWVLCQ